MSTATNPVMPLCPYCAEPFPSEPAVNAHVRNYCKVLFQEPKERCERGCMAYHVHEMKDGKWSVFFDDMPQVTVDTEEEARREMSELTRPEGDPRS